MKQIKRRFITSAMSAFLILLFLIVGSIILVSYTQMEQQGTAFIQQMLNEQEPFPAFPPERELEKLPVPLRAPSGYYDITTDENGQITKQDVRGIMDPEEHQVDEMVRQILSAERTTGHINPFKYGTTVIQDGTRIILLDQTFQLQFIYSNLRGALLVSAACLLLMFVILLPISRRVAKAIETTQERQRQFITNANHEMKTPVAVIQSNIEAMEMINGQTKWSRNVHQQTLRLNYMISQLLLLERMGERTYQSPKKPIDIGSLIKTVAEDMDELLAKRNIRIDIDIGVPCVICGYEEALNQLIRILVDNAARYASEGSSLSISVVRHGRAMTIHFLNRVEHVPVCAPELLFERFHRGGITRKTGDVGCGIGLSAASSIVSMHHGEISASYPNVHSFQITIKLPTK